MFIAEVQFITARYTKLKTVSSMHIVNEIKKLRIGRAAGPDNIPITVVRDVGDIVVKPLTMILNSSLENGIVTDIWKLAKVIPIFKLEVNRDVNNYRPISLIFLENYVLTKNQSAFRKLHSTITSLIGNTDYWYGNVDSKKLNLKIFLDLRKEFDTVDHDIMIKKLWKYGMRGNTRSWFQSYLDQRKQYCSGSGQRSMASEVTYGIHQGSCLGPLLFIIYLNDSEKRLRFSKASVYADDTTVTITSNDVEKILHEAQQELFNLSEWMRINKLSPNPAKAEYMIKGHSLKLNTLNTSNPLSIKGTDIKHVTKTKSLGIVVDENLLWNEQYIWGTFTIKKVKNIIR